MVNQQKVINKKIVKRDKFIPNANNIKVQPDKKVTYDKR